MNSWLQSAKWTVLLAVVVAASFWKILFTNQFSIIIGWEGTNQAYSWYTFAARSIHQGIPPFWNPYTLSGHSYLGETQTGLFYPLKLLLYLAPFTDGGVLSERAFHQVYVLAHLLGAIFMFFCAKEVGVTDRFSAFIAASCFTLGGFVGRQGWVHQMDSAIWLPLIFLFLLRALRSELSSTRILNACWSGLCLGMAILAGSIHAPLMDVLVVATAAAYGVFVPTVPSSASAPRRSVLIRSAAIVFVIAAVSFAAASVQLLPSMEYSKLATRWTGEWGAPFHQRIPYEVTGDHYHLGPRSLFAFLFGAADLGGGEFSPYMGVLPLILAVVGLWRNWTRPWVRYLAILGLLAFFYSMGAYFLLHGLLYLLVPYMDKAWEAGRFIYLTNFAMALLVGFGTQSLFSNEPTGEHFFSRLNRVLQWTVLVVMVAVGVPALYGKPDAGEWSYFSFLFLLASWGTFVYVIRGNRTGTARFLLAAVIICDLYAFNWVLLNKMEYQKSSSNQLAVMLNTRKMAEFLKSQPGLFRVDMENDFPPSSMGDVFAVQTTQGWGATMLTDYLPVLWSPQGRCLFNVRYFVSTGKDRTDTPVFTDGQWKVYEQSPYCPRGWLVHRVLVESSPKEVMDRLQQADFDPLRVAYVTEPLEPELQDWAAPEEVTFRHYQGDWFELEATASSTGLLVLSEIYYPGWNATVNGRPARVHQVDRMLRGIVVSPGRNRIVMQYRPASVRIGAILSFTAFLGTFFFAALVFLRERRSMAP